jgi:hypothetical protein
MGWYGALSATCVASSSSAASKRLVVAISRLVIGFACFFVTGEIAGRPTESSESRRAFSRVN